MTEEDRAISTNNEKRFNDEPQETGATSKRTKVPANVRDSTKSDAPTSEPEPAKATAAKITKSIEEVRTVRLHAYNALEHHALKSVSKGTAESLTSLKTQVEQVGHGARRSVGHD